jgi:hypothetical protein
VVTGLSPIRGVEVWDGRALDEFEMERAVKDENGHADFETQKTR